MLIMRLCYVGSWDGEIRLWKLDDKLKSFSLVSSIPALGVVNSLQLILCPRGALANAAWAQADRAHAEANGVPAANSSESGVRVKARSHVAAGAGQSVLLVAGVGQELRFGRWVARKGEDHLNGALVVALHPRTSSEMSGSKT